MEVARALRAQGRRVRALAHRKDSRSDALQRLGAEVMQVDGFDVAQISDALRGVDAAYYVPVFTPGALRAATAFALAARAARLKAIVQMSQWLSHSMHPSLLTRETWLIDQLLATLPGVAHVIVNPGMFADNFLRVIDFATHLRVFPVLTGASRCAPISNEDIGRVVAAVLMDPDRFAGQRLRPTGPTLMDGTDMAKAISNAIGKPVLPVRLPFWMFNRAARITGAPVYEIANFKYYLHDHKEGAFSINGGVTDVVERLTGQPAEDFSTIAHRYAALPFAANTARLRIRSMLRFAATPLFPGYALKPYEAALGFSERGMASLSVHDDEWLTTHDTSRPPPSVIAQPARPAASYRSHPV
jgi:uncharacterized protein YbjT (DUF2867 family)